MYIFKKKLIFFSYFGVDIINKRIIKNIKLYGTILALTISSYTISNKVIKSNKEFINSIVKEKNIEDLNDYVLQGICKVDDNYLITAYNSNRENNSIIYIFDSQLEKYRIREINTRSHVGGITYDPNNNNIWITDTNGTISAYDKNELLSTKKDVEAKFKNIYVGKELNNYYGTCSVAYITYNNNKLYVGNFNDKRNSIIKEYNILKNGMIEVDNYNKINLSEYVQGIAFYEDDDTKYLITSSSYGRLFYSKLKIYNYEDLELIKELKTKELMEEILVDDDKLITIYESNAIIYKKDERGKDIIISNIDKILTK